MPTNNWLTVTVTQYGGANSVTYFDTIDYGGDWNNMPDGDNLFVIDIESGSTIEEWISDDLVLLDMMNNVPVTIKFDGVYYESYIDDYETSTYALDYYYETFEILKRGEDG